MPRRTNRKNNATGKWSFGFCDPTIACTDCDVLIQVTMCYPFCLSKYKADMDNSSCCFNSLCFCCMCVCCTARTTARTHFNVPGSIGEDCLYGCLCPCLSAVQIGNELKYEYELQSRPASNQPSVFQMPFVITQAPPAAQNMA